jgi:hypothetical protein
MQPAEQSDNQPGTKGQLSMTGLLGDITHGVRELVREEIRMARNEVTDKASDVAFDAGMVAVGGVVAYAGYQTILGGAVDVLRRVGMPRWVAGMLVGAMALSGGVALILRGLDNLQLKDAVVEGTKDQVRESVDHIESDLD